MSKANRLVIRRASVEPFLRNLCRSEHSIKRGRPEGIFIGSGEILNRTLRHSLKRQCLPADEIAQYTTFERLAMELLRDNSQPCGILNQEIRIRRTKQLLKLAANGQAGNLPACSAGESDALKQIAQSGLYKDEGSMERLIGELDDYLRMTDAGRDTQGALEAVEMLSDEHSAEKSRRSLRAFRGITKDLEWMLDEHGLDTHQSRSHLVRAARSYVSGGDSKAFDGVEWVAVVGVSVFDSPTLRLLVEIATAPNGPEVNIFCNGGSYEYNKTRFSNVESVRVTCKPARDTPISSPEAAALFETAIGRDAAAPGANFLSAPSKKAALVRVAHEIKQLFDDGVPAPAIKIVAPDAASKQGPVNRAFEAVGVPVFVEARQQFARMRPYGCLKAVLTAAESLAEDGGIDLDTLLSPLERGYCSPNGSLSDWPIEDEDLSSFRAAFEKQQTSNGSTTRYLDGGHLDANRFEEIRRRSGQSDADWASLRMYLETLSDLGASHPADGAALVSELRDILQSFARHMMEQGHPRPGPLGLETAPTNLRGYHMSGCAEILEKNLGGVRRHYDRILELFDTTAGWGEAREAVEATLGNDSVGGEHLNRNAVGLVDFGNAFFQSADHLFILGMNAQEFLPEPTEPWFLQSEFRKTVQERAMDGDSAYTHIDSKLISRNRWLDSYQAALAVANRDAEITLLHTHRDPEHNEIPWSDAVGDAQLDPEAGCEMNGQERMLQGEPPGGW